VFVAVNRDYHKRQVPNETLPHDLKLFANLDSMYVDARRNLEGAILSCD
jgi:hypothetical protein